MLITVLEKDKYLRQAKQRQHHCNIMGGAGGRRQDHYIETYNEINS